MIPPFPDPIAPHLAVRRNQLGVLIT